MTDIVWRLDEAEAVELHALLEELQEYLDYEDDDTGVAQVAGWVRELASLITEREAYTASLQPELPYVRLLQ